MFQVWLFYNIGAYKNIRVEILFVYVCCTCFLFERLFAVSVLKEPECFLELIYEHCIFCLLFLSPFAKGQEQHLHVIKDDLKGPTVHILTNKSVVHIRINMCFIELLYSV